MIKIKPTDMPSLQDIYDNSPEYSMIYLPESETPYEMKYPLMVDKPNRKIKGDGLGTRIVMSQYVKHSPFVVGVRRNESGQVIDDKYFYQRGNSWGLRTNGDTFIQIQNHGFQTGKPYKDYTYSPGYWSNVDALTIDCMLEPDPNNPWKPGSPLFGITGDSQNAYQSFPFSLSVGDQPNIFVFGFRTDDIVEGQYSHDRSIIFNVGTTSPYSVKIKLNLKQGSYAVSVNGQNVPAIFVDSAGSKNFAPGMKLISNQTIPFMIGAAGLRAKLNSTTPLILYGLHIRDGIQDDFNLYNSTLDTISLISSIDPKVAGRLLPIEAGPKQGGGIGSAYWLQAKVYPAGELNVVFDGLNISCSNGGGPGFLIGDVLEFSVSHCQIQYGQQAVGSLNGVADYNIWLDRNVLHGYDCAYYGFDQMLVATRNTVVSGGRDVLRFVSSDVVWEKSLVLFPSEVGQTISSSYAGDYAGSYVFRDFNYDTESSPLGKCGFYIEQHPYVQTQFGLENVKMGNISNNVPGVLLKRMNTTYTDTWKECKGCISNLQGGGFSPVVRIINGSTTQNIYASGRGVFSKSDFTW